MKYFIDHDEKHLDALLLHLRAHNNSFTGEKKSEKKFIYVTCNNELQGAIETNLSWDWVGLRHAYYQNLNVLKELVATVCTAYKGKVEGLKTICQEGKRHHDFLAVGFEDKGIIKGTNKGKDTYFSDLTSLSIQQNQQYHTISSEAVDERYDKIVKEKVNQYKKTHQINEDIEEVLFVALDNETFAGGIKLELYEDSMYIDLLAVNPNYRKQNIGTKLMEFAEELAIKKKFERIELGTTEFQAKSFYEKLGYEVVFTRQNLPKGFECYTLIKQLK